MPPMPPMPPVQDIQNGAYAALATNDSTTAEIETEGVQASEIRVDSVVQHETSGPILSFSSFQNDGFEEIELSDLSSNSDPFKPSSDKILGEHSV